MKRENINIEKHLLFCELYKISRCNNCGYGIYERHISEETLAAYYQNDYWTSDRYELNLYNAGEPFISDDRANGQYRIVKNYIEKHTQLNILEIGAGAALFSRLVRFHHPEAKINVVEPGIRWDKYYDEFSINKIADFFPFTSTARYNYIHTSHWLEHVTPDIEKIIINLNNFLLLNGLLFIEVPNCNSEYWNSDCGDTPHIHFFTEKSLVLLIEQKGFKCLDLGVYGATISETLDYFHPNTKKEYPSKALIAEVEKSIRESIPRKDGGCLRALFRKVS